MEIEKYYFVCFSFLSFSLFCPTTQAWNIESTEATRVSINGIWRSLFVVYTKHLYHRKDAASVKKEPKNKLHYYLYGFRFNNFFKFISQILLSVMYIIGSWGKKSLLDVITHRCFHVLCHCCSWSRTEIF